VRAVLFLLFAACASTATAPSSKPASSVSLATSDGVSVKVDVEVVDTDATRMQGLMNRPSLGENAGMLFLFPREEQLAFWMKNTLIPLDMIFIRSDMSILGIVENAEPLTLTNRSVPGDSQYVLEVNGGYAHKHGLSAGGRVRFDNVPSPPKS